MECVSNAINQMNSREEARTSRSQEIFSHNLLFMT